MERSSTFHFNFEFSNPNESYFGEVGKLTLYKNSEEGMPHIAMKLLSYFFVLPSRLTG